MGATLKLKQKWKQTFQKYEKYLQEAFLQQRNNQPNTNIHTFYATFKVQRTQWEKNWVKKAAEETHSRGAGVEHVSNSSAHLEQQLTRSLHLVQVVLQVREHENQQGVEIWNLRDGDDSKPTSSC